MSSRKNREPCVHGVRMLCKYCNQKKVCPDSEYSQKYVPYICDGEKWIRMYDEDEVELMKKEAYEQGFKDGMAALRGGNYES